MPVKLRRFFPAFVLITLIIGVSLGTPAAEGPGREVTILYTNDFHTNSFLAEGGSIIPSPASSSRAPVNHSPT